MLWVRISIRARCTALCDKVCQWLAPGRWFSPDPPVSSTNKTDRYDLTEILLKHHQTNNMFFSYFCCFVYCVIYQDWFCFCYLTLWQIRMFLFFYVMATQICIWILYFIATHNYFYSVYFMANHDCFHCVTLFTLWPIMIVFTVSICLLYGQSWLVSLCHFVYSMANQEFFALVTLWPICFCSLSCTQNCLCLWTVHPFLTLRFSLTLCSSF